MPVATSIEWKPLRDSHYILATLRPGGGGFRRIFARQSTLAEVQAVSRATPERPIVGLLLGERLDCPLTLTPYLLIESHVEVAVESLDAGAVTGAIRMLRERAGRGHSADVLGWYCGSRSAEPTVSRTHASVHAACFEERWQPALIFADGANSAAFFLYDSSAARWFHTPFSEVTDAKARDRGAMPTCVAWPEYLTTASVVPLTDTPRPAPLKAQRASAVVPARAPSGRSAGALSRMAVIVRRTPANAMVGVRRATVAARRSGFDVAITILARVALAAEYVGERIRRVRAARSARMARRQAEAAAARAREEERRARVAAERRAAREEAQRRAAEAEKRRAAEAEARRKAAEAEAEARRQAAEAEARRQAEAAAAEAQRRAEEEEARRAAEAEAQRQAAEEAARRAAEAKARRIAAEEAQRKAAEEERRLAAEAEARRQAAEAEARRLNEEAEARRVAEAEAEARRQAAEAATRRAAEAEALRVSLVVAAIRKHPAHIPFEGTEHETPRMVRAPSAPMADHDDTKASDGANRYLSLAMREGFEVSVKLDRGSAEIPETLWLLSESESGLRLIVVTVDDVLREASLHYNLRTEDDALLQNTAPEQRDLESRTIYIREDCLTGLRARCRRLRATGALERDWKVLPT